MRRAFFTEAVPSASLRVFRFGFGLLMAIALVRLHLTGWTSPLFLEPTFRFEYALFSWVPPIPKALVVPCIFAGAAGALALGFGRAWVRRAGGALFLVCFSWLKLFDVTNYLNHDYLAVLLASLLTVLPVDGASIPRWVLRLVRFQVGVVYVHAGLAKINTDWLLEAQPLTTWFSANRGLPVIGGLLGLPGVPQVASVLSCVYDCTIVAWLSIRRTRPYAFAAVLTFHGLTHALFDIGIFPFLMTLAATVFFDAARPRRWGGFLESPSPVVTWAPSVKTSAFAVAPARVLGVSAVVGYVLFQALFPLRSHVMGNDVLWDEVGMRWSWRVMVREKNGSVTFRARVEERVVEVPVSETLLPRQANEMSGQPDLIVQLAQHLGRALETKTGKPVAVFVDAWVSLNGRPPRRLFNPEVDLMTLSSDELTAALLPSPRLSTPAQVARW
jgi:hypothetical protein